jgi:hypothetical protein
MIRVRVQRIESIKDPEGNLGKRIELVEESMVPRFALRPPSEEGRMVQDVFKALQEQMPVLNVQGQLSFPKIILFLSEREYEELGVNFDVNQLYDVELNNQSLRFNKTP